MPSLFLIIVLVVLGAACQAQPPQIVYDDLPPGDGERGQMVYMEAVNGAPSCISCHRVDGRPGVGPPLQGLAKIAGERVEGQSAGEYIYLSIIRPSSYVVRGYSNLMYSEYESNLSIQQIADIVAYLFEL